MENIHDKYIDFLINNKHWPKYFSYAIINDTTEKILKTIKETDNTYEINQVEIDKEKEMIFRYYIGFNCSLPINIIVLKKYTRMLTFQVKVFDYEEEFNVYINTKISPELFYNKISKKIDSLFFIKTGDIKFNSFKDYYNEKKKNMFVNYKGKL